MIRWMQATAAAMVAALAVAASPAGADPIADFYKGKQINWILSAGAGGGYSTYAHAFQTYFSKHIPGNPSIVVQNMPGAGGIRAMIYLYSVAPKDGTTIGLVHSSVPFAPLFGLEGAKFDARKFNWLGSINKATGICISWHTAPVKTAQDLWDKEFIVGGTGAAGDFEITANVLRNLLGMKYRIISGYPGSHEALLAMERSEIQGLADYAWGSVRSQQADWVKNGTKIGRAHV